MVRRRKRKKDWKEDDRVAVAFDGELYFGSIAEITKSEAKVLFDDGEVIDIKLSELQPLPQTIKEGDFIPEGFSQYNIKWDNRLTNFQFKAEEGKFYGWWRKTEIKGGGTGYGIDLHVEYKGKGCFIETLGYLNKDPRENIESLNADICAAANKWFYYQCEGTFDTLSQLQQKVDKPTLIVSKLNTLDKMIVDLKDCRDLSLRSGGARIVILTGDNPDKDPKDGVRININLTAQAAALEGKVPPLLFESAAIDGVTTSKAKRGEGKTKRTEAIATTNQKTIDELLGKLGSSKDKREQRKIRGTLRRMGHRGGVRQEKGGKKK